MTKIQVKESVERIPLMKPEDQARLRRLIGIRLENFRLAKGWSQTDFYRRSGIDPSNLRKYESGKRVPSIPTAAVMAKALGITYVDLLNVDFKMSENDTQDC